MPPTPPDQMSAYTFRDLIIAVAVYRGTVDYDENGKQVIPDDAGELAKCRSIVRKAWERVCYDNPRWRWMRQVVTISLPSGSEEITMPWYFDGRLLGPMTFLDSTNTLRSVITEVDELEIRTLRSATAASGAPPTLVAFYRKHAEYAAGEPRNDLYTAAFYPTPDRDYTLKCAITAQPFRMWELDDRHFAGGQFNRLIERACVAEAELDEKRMYAEMDQVYRDVLQQAMELDKETGPKILGCLSSDEDDVVNIRPFGTLYQDGVALS